MHRFGVLLHWGGLWPPWVTPDAMRLQASFGHRQGGGQLPPAPGRFPPTSPRHRWALGRRQVWPSQPTHRGLLSPSCAPLGTCSGQAPLGFRIPWLHQPLPLASLPSLSGEGEGPAAGQGGNILAGEYTPGFLQRVCLCGREWKGCQIWHPNPGNFAFNLGVAKFSFASVAAKPPARAGLCNRLQSKGGKGGNFK